MQLDEQPGEGVEHLVASVAETPPLEQFAVGEGVLEVHGDDRRGRFLSGVQPGPFDEPDGLH